jgi:Arc/MetJ-type ribon-helix-helix transcriptional regulator
MIQIILDSEQEKLLEEQLKTGKYRTPNEVITHALKILAQRQHLNQEGQRITILSGEPAQKLLEEKIKMMQEIKENYQPDTHRQKLAEQFSQLCQETQELHADHPLTDAEIDEEIAAYRRGE